jgi:ABC-type nitrate/sulfonate/bicarbonate transport system substrate-binding protein
MVAFEGAIEGVKSVNRRSLLLAVPACLAGTIRIPRMAVAASPLKIGYQSLWAPAGLVFETLRNTNILTLNGLSGTFSTFSQGGPLAEAFVASSVDTISGADVPVLRGVARRPGSKIVMRCIDWRWGIVVGPQLAEPNIESLRGARLGGSFVAGSWVGALRTIRSKGLDPQHDMTLVNLDVSDIGAALQQKIVDAVVTWDPTLEKLLSSKLGRLAYLSTPQQALGWQAVSADFIRLNGEIGVVNFIKAWAMASAWASMNPSKAISWFNATSRIDKDVLTASLSADRILKTANSDLANLDFLIRETDIGYAQEVMDSLLSQQGAASTKLDVASLVDMTFARRAMADLASGKHPSLGDILEQN